MGIKWSTGRLGDYVESCLGKMLDKEKNRGEFYPYLGNKNVRWGSFDLDDLAQMRFEEHEHERYGLQHGDLIICEGGEPGRCAIWTEQVPNMKIQKALHRVRPLQELNNYYLHYWFTWAGKNGLLDAYFTGTTIKHLTGKALADLEIPIPPLAEQESMVRILKSLDDKIALNRQINTTLESMAQALFKSWFVDFDPVIDNALAAGNPIPDALQARADKRRARVEATGGSPDASLPAEVQQRFPSSFVFTEEMGWVPEGWGFGPVYNVAKFINGAAFKSVHFCNEGQGLPVIKIAELKNGISGQTKFTNQDVDQKYKISDGDILFSWSGNPDTSIDTFIWQRGEGWLNQHIFKVSLHKSDEYAYIYSLLKSLKPVFAEIARDKQTTGLGHVTAGDMKRLNVISPPSEINKAFNAIASSLIGKRNLAYYEVNTLVNLRDSLLPKLLSGQLQIPEAEQQLAEAL